MTEPDPWRCAVCATSYPVPSLARHCAANDNAARVRDGFDRISESLSSPDEESK